MAVNKITFRRTPRNLVEITK